MEIRVIDITPEIAKRMLERNTSNRNVREPIVNAYIRGDSVKLLKWQRGGASKEEFPKILFS